MLKDLIIKPKKSESKEFLCFRRSVIVILLSALTVFFMVLIMKLNDEKPNISIDFQPKNATPVPSHYSSYFLELKVNITKIMISNIK
jgi:hypothetical protein